MTLHELGITDIDCGLDPDGLLDGPSADRTGLADDLDASDEDGPVVVDNDEPRYGCP